MIFIVFNYNQKHIQSVNLYRRNVVVSGGETKIENHYYKLCANVPMIYSKHYPMAMYSKTLYIKPTFMCSPTFMLDGTEYDLHIQICFVISRYICICHIMFFTQYQACLYIQLYTYIFRIILYDFKLNYPLRLDSGVSGVETASAMYLII